MMDSALAIVLEFARTQTPEDPYAFCLGTQQYTLRTIRGGRKSVELDWGDSLLADLKALRKPRCESGVLRRLARKLTGFLEPAGWSWYARDIDEAVLQQQPVVMTIRSAAAELYALPWELLTLGGSGQCLGELPGVLIRYEWPETNTVPHAVAQSGKGRVLFAWSAAAAPVPAAAHQAAIADAGEASGFAFDLSRDVIDHASYGKLADAFEAAARAEEPITALHLLCHGGQDGEVFGVVLNGEEGTASAGGAVVVDGWRLRQLLGPYAATLRMVVVAACNSGRTGPFDSLAQSLHRAGIETVLASRFPLSTAGSVRIAKALYHSLLVERAPLERAFLNARKQLARDAAYLDWASLQLYARQQDGDARYPLLPKKDETAAQRSDSMIIASIGLGTLGLSGLLQLQHQVERELGRRFEREQALMMVADAGLAEYAARYGAGPARARQQLMHEQLNTATIGYSGLLADLERGGECACFDDASDALRALLAFLDALADKNFDRGREKQVIVRAALHQGSIHTDGTIVAGPNAELLRRMCDIAAPGEVLVSREARGQVPPVEQLYCRRKSSLERVDSGPLQLYSYAWRAQRALPSMLLISDTGQQHPLPKQDVISFGRLRLREDGSRANDVILNHPDTGKLKMISRSHFELRRRGDQFLLVALSSQPTWVDNEVLGRGERKPVAAGSKIILSNVMRLELLAGTRPKPTMTSTRVDLEATIHGPPAD